VEVKIDVIARFPGDGSAKIVAIAFNHTVHKAVASEYIDGRCHVTLKNGKILKVRYKRDENNWYTEI